MMNGRMPNKAPRKRQRGAVMVEYAFLLVAVAIPAMVGIAAGGASMLKKFQATRSQILETVP
jgi:Flp pilus assembly pilin Flp